MRILAFDMGLRSTAWAITEAGALVECGMMQNPISELTEQFNRQKRKFIRECKVLFSKLSEDSVVLAERFQMRQFNSGKQIECVSIMLGLIAATSPVKTYLIIPAEWKNSYLRNYSENVMEVILRDDFNEHECDAIGLSLWYYEQKLGEKSAWLAGYFPIEKSCKRCWYRYNGCKGVKEKICPSFLEINKQSKCAKCKYIEPCKKEIEKEYGKGQVKKFKRTTHGCSEFKEIKK